MAGRRLSGLVAAVALAAALPAAASAQGVLTLSGGYFAVRGEDGRPEDDVLRRNLDFLAFDLDDFGGFTINGEYHFPLGDYLEVGGGVGYYQNSVPSVYRDVIDSDGSEIFQELKLRVVPFTATARFYPFTRQAPVQPYIGAGLGVFWWRYAETGEWVDDTDDTIFRNSYVDDGAEFGPVILAGVRFPVGDMFAAGGEFRYQDAKPDLDPDQGFAGDRIDLGGYTWLATFQWRF